MAATSTASQYRPLNVRDALSYLDQVKVQFFERPEVYNRFLDVMKEFKGQIIDTPGVIDRVSNLFRGHPNLIQGFNTFLPPGYRIECINNGDSNVISVTTPSGTTSHVQGDKDDRKSRAPSPTRAAKQEPAKAKTGAITPSAIPERTSGPSTPSAATVLASGMKPRTDSGPGPGPVPNQQSRHYALEFNHAITFVNKIKNRFNADAETYKQFLEILQTYQREGKEIQEVYDQVTRLFSGAPDLIAEFKQFLPEDGSGPMRSMGFGSVVQAAADTSMAAKKIKDVPSKKRKGPDAKANKKRKADTPSDDETAPPANEQQTLASAEEVAFFDKVKKYVDDKVTYHEFLKLINLFTQDMIDTRTLVDRAEHFIGNSPDIWATFRSMVLVDDAGNPPPHPSSAQAGYGFGGMINADGQPVENVPMLERVKPDLNGPKVKTYGPSYRKLPKTEINLVCSGRDALCWEVLNDEWVSHPTWAAEDAAPFMAHKKNIYEEALHKSEEERHEYDYHIEANLRTIALLEPLNNKLQTMEAEERQRFTLKSGLGGQSKSIYYRVIKKVYGKELGYDIIRALMDNPVVALPIVLERLKAKDDEWKKAQREWNRVWREQDAKNFYKALDHQGITFKQTDKKTIGSKQLLNELEARRREQLKTRGQLLDASVWRSKPQFEFDFSDIEVLQDVIKLVISYLDRVNNQLPLKDRERIEHQLRDFVPMLWMLDKEEFDADFGAAERGSDDEDDSEDESVDDERKKKVEPADLRKRLLKSVGERERGGTMTPGLDDDMSEGTPATEGGERAETPLPVPDDPQAVADAVEKDKEQADAGEQTWVDVQIAPAPQQTQDVDMDASESSAKNDRRMKRKGLCFSNVHLYTVVRLVQILYSRLLNCKTAAAKMAEEVKRPINPVAIHLGLAEPDTSHFSIQAGNNPAEHYYGHLLNLAEKLFEAEIDAATFEESLRVMFGTKAYVMFTLDRVVAAIVKAVQVVCTDMKSQELLALLERDRQNENVSLRQQIAYRFQAETVIDQDALIKIETHPSRNVLAISFLSREDPTITDLETAEQEWRCYVDSYVLTHKTEGLAQRVDAPLLKRNLNNAELDEYDNFERSDGLSCRIAYGTYKMFAVEETEDYFYRRHEGGAEGDGDGESAEAINDAARKKLDAFVASKLEMI